MSSSTSDLSDEKLNNDQRSSKTASWRCPNCNHELDCNPDMVGFPAGVKFDPSDQELLEHLESMVKEGGSRAHPLIGDFIPTLQGNDGICYTHPENLPGVTRDGVSKHFFHRSSKAYTSGTRKRRKIQSERGLRSSDHVGEARWHKTGKTRPVIVGGQQKGCKKILVLYSNYGKQGTKPEKTNWVMHQYHLGSEDEKDGELVVSKVFYQQTLLRSTATMTEQNDEKVEVTSEAMHDMLPGSAAEAAEAADTMMQIQQQHQLRPADGQSRFTTAKTSHEVGVGDPLSGDQGQLHEIHHKPSQHKVQSVLVKPVHTMSFVERTPLSTESTKLSPAVKYRSALLNNGGKQEDQQQQKKVDCRRPCSSEEAMIASQTTSTQEDVPEASTQPKEIQRPYQHWPPDHTKMDSTASCNHKKSRCKS